MLPLIPHPRRWIPSSGIAVWPAESPVRPRHLYGLALNSELVIGPELKVRVIQDAQIAREGYVLTVEPQEFVIRASTREGLLHAVSTVTQLSQASPEIPCGRIEDEPQFAWRGMMLDSARHFQPYEWVLRFIDLLQKYKFNRLHLHLCDDQGWRIEIKKYPKLTEIGSKRMGTPVRPLETEHDGIPHQGYYTQDQLRNIVLYAAERGITVMPEIEMPGHCQAALAAYPELGNTGQTLEPWPQFGVNENVYGVHERVFTFLEEVLEEVLDIFPSEFIHVGGDEVPKTQWKSSETAQQLIRERGLKDEDELQSYFIRHFDRWLQERGRRLIGWDEILEGGLAPGAAVMSWRGMQGGIDAAKMGHDVVMAPVQHCYFDHFESRLKFQEPIAIGGYLPLSKVYAFDPIPESLSTSEKKHVLGGQGQLWSEYLRTTDRVEYAALPRMLALAEVLWGKPEGGFEGFMERLPERVAQLQRDGWNPRKLQPELPEGWIKVSEWKLGELCAEPVSYEIRRNSLPAEGKLAFHYSGGAYGAFMRDITLYKGAVTLITLDQEGSVGNVDLNNHFELPDLDWDRISWTLTSKGNDNTLGDVFWAPSTNPEGDVS